MNLPAPAFSGKPLSRSYEKRNRSPSPELSLLAACCTRCDGLPGGTAMSMVSPGTAIDWNVFLKLAVRHKLAFQAYEALKDGVFEFGRFRVPEDILRQLKLRAGTQRAFTVHLLQEAQKVTAALDAAGILHAVVKGPVLSRQLYADEFRRQYRDLDLVVRTADLLGTIPVLGTCGYELKSGIPDGVVEARGKHIVFSGGGIGLNIEIHAGRFDDLSMLFPVPEDELFSSLVRLPLGSGFLPTFADELHAVFVLSHGAAHGWCIIRWILDAALLFSRMNPDALSSLFSRLRALDLERIGAAACRLSAEFFGTPLPEPVLSLPDRTLSAADRIAAYCRSLVIDGKVGNETIPGKAAWFFRYLPLLRTNAGYRLYQMSVWLKGHEVDNEVLRLPKGLSVFRPLFRPLIILKRRAAERRSGRN